MTEDFHFGPHPEWEYLTQHVGPKKDCSGPDCGQQDIPMIPDGNGHEYEHPFPANELMYIYFDEHYEQGTTRRESWVPGFDGHPNAMTSHMVHKRKSGHWVRDYVDTEKINPIFMDRDVQFKHRPVLDIDFPVKVVPSSTPGHFHLYLDKEMSWEVYEELLKALGKAGILEEGYVRASIAREHTSVRLPWIKKEYDDTTEG